MSTLANNKFDNCKPEVGQSKIAPMDKDVRWPYFAQRFSELLERTGVTLYRLDEDTPLRAPNLSKIKAGTRRATDDVLMALSAYEPLGVTFAELESWRLMDEYSQEAIELVLKKFIKTPKDKQKALEIWEEVAKERKKK